jgi:hypothetical protein
MSTGELTVIPEVIYLTKEKLKRRLKRSPTEHELAAELKMSPSALSKLKHVKVKYNETTLTPSFARGAVAYRHAKPWSKKHRGNRFASGTQYDSDGGGKRKRRHSRRSRKNLGQRRKRSNRKSYGSKRLCLQKGGTEDKLKLLQDSYSNRWYDIYEYVISLQKKGNWDDDKFKAILNEKVTTIQKEPEYSALAPYNFNYENRFTKFKSYMDKAYFSPGTSLEYMDLQAARIP